MEEGGEEVEDHEEFDVLGISGQWPVVSGQIEVDGGDEMFNEFEFVFGGFDGDEGEAEEEGGGECELDGAFFVEVGEVDGEGHGERAGEEYAGVDGTESFVEVAASFLPGGGESVAVDGVGHEEAAEEEDFGGEKGPHAEGGGFVLLEGVVELVGVGGHGVSSFEFPVSRRWSGVSRMGASFWARRLG